MDSVSPRSHCEPVRERVAGACAAARQASAPPTSVPPGQLPMLGADLARASPGPLARLVQQKPAMRGSETSGVEDDPDDQRALDNALKLGRSATIAMLAQGSCFGASFALAGHLRVRGGPVVKVAAGLLPVVAAALTAPLERSLREFIGDRGTRPRTPSLWHDAIPSVVLFGLHAWYLKASSLPKFPPSSGRGAAMTGVLSLAGTFLAGGLTEAAAQFSNRRDPDAATPRPPPDRAETGRIAVGRALSLMPMFAYMQLPAAYLTHQGSVPARLALFPIGVATAGWTLRRLLMPPAPVEQASTPQAASRQEPPAQPASAPA